MGGVGGGGRNREFSPLPINLRERWHTTAKVNAGNLAQSSSTRRPTDGARVDVDGKGASCMIGHLFNYRDLSNALLTLTDRARPPFFPRETFLFAFRECATLSGDFHSTASKVLYTDIVLWKKIDNREKYQMNTNVTLLLQFIPIFHCTCPEHEISLYIFAVNTLYNCDSASTIFSNSLNYWRVAIRRTHQHFFLFLKLLAMSEVRL